MLSQGLRLSDTLHSSEESTKYEVTDEILKLILTDFISSRKNENSRSTNSLNFQLHLWPLTFFFSLILSELYLYLLDDNSIWIQCEERINLRRDLAVATGLGTRRSPTDCV
jgi:hypothetical protein